MSKPIYIHTINGQPAAYQHYVGEDHLFYVKSWSKAHASQVFVNSLAKIHKQQQLVIDYRRSVNILDENDTYGYIVLTNDLGIQL